MYVLALSDYKLLKFRIQPALAKSETSVKIYLVNLA